MAIKIKQGNRRCDATCHNATGEKCECVCNGKNHGVLARAAQKAQGGLLINCPGCGSAKVRVEITELYNAEADLEYKTGSVEDDSSHDLEYGTVRCSGCGEPRDIDPEEVYQIAIG